MLTLTPWPSTGTDQTAEHAHHDADRDQLPDGRPLLGRAVALPPVVVGPAELGEGGDRHQGGRECREGPEELPEAVGHEQRHQLEHGEQDRQHPDDHDPRRTPPQHAGSEPAHDQPAQQHRHHREHGVVVLEAPLGDGHDLARQPSPRHHPRGPRKCGPGHGRPSPVVAHPRILAGCSRTGVETRRRGGSTTRPSSTGDDPTGPAVTFHPADVTFPTRGSATMSP